MSWVNSLSNRDLLAKTLEAEAGNQGIGGMMAVGAVVMNRMGSGQSIRDVILAPLQFSPWNKVTAGLDEQAQDMENLQPSQDAYAVADSLLSGNYVDPTGGAKNFYNPDISSPSWGPENTSDWLRIGDHIFGTAGGKKPVATPNQRPNILNAVQNAQRNLPSQQPMKTGFPGIMQALQDPRTQNVLGALSRSDTGRRLQQSAQDAMKAEAAAAGGPTVRSQTLYRNGTLVQSTDQGPRVFDPDGKQVFGADARRVVQEANDAETILRQQDAAGSKIGALTSELAMDIYKDVQNVNDSIKVIDEAIDAIDSGAQTGVFLSWLPNVTTASAQLQTAMDKMGLNVIQSASFGALSEAEMKLAMEVDSPRNLSGPALREYLVEKRAAQIKARSALTRAATYLAKPGNTIEGWMKKNEQEQSQEAPSNPYMGKSLEELTAIWNAEGNTMTAAQKEQFQEAVEALPDE